MKNTKFPPFVFGLLLVANILYSQESKQSIILINSKPVLVEMAPDGKIIKVIRDEPASLVGYDISLQPVPVPVPVPVVSPIAPSSTKTLEQLPSHNDANQMASSRKESTILEFDVGYATLTNEAIKQLDRKILELKNDPTLFAILSSISVEKDLPISKNRLNGAKQYMRLRGIDSHRLITEPLIGAVITPEVKISLAAGVTQSSNE
jgi:hypothetical protein